MLRTYVATLVGTGIVLLTVHDVLHELFNPESTGSLSRKVMHGVWRMVRAVARHRHQTLYSAGLLVVVSVMLVWLTLLTLGWALIYWPRLPDAFSAGAGVPAGARLGFDTAVYLSLAALTTLNASGIEPLTSGMRLSLAVESCLGLMVFTAWITWIISVYPVLAVRRSLAREVSLLRHAERHPEQAIAGSPPEAAAQVLRSLLEQVVKVTAELRQLPVTYYFQHDLPQETLARQLPYLLGLARAAEQRGPAPYIRHHGHMLRIALEDLLREVGEQYLDLHEAPPEAVITALADDHLVEGVRAAEDERMEGAG